MWFSTTGNSPQPECRGARKKHSDKVELMRKKHGVEGGVDGNEIEPFQGPKEVKGRQEVQKKIERPF